jgi:hypothetical protein
LIGWLPLGLDSSIPGLTSGAFSRYWLREPPVTFTIARFLFGLSLLGLAMLIVAIPQMFYLASTCAVYINLRRDLPPPERGGFPMGGTPSAAGQVREGDQKRCRQCGALLARDQSYCPHCKQMQ